MEKLPSCPKCNSEYTYEDGHLYVCPECAYEWNNVSTESEIYQEKLVVKDANGNILNDGDFVTVIKDLKVKGASSSIKVGTKIKILRLVDSDHNLDCRVEGIGEMGLKSQFVKKVT